MRIGKLLFTASLMFCAGTLTAPSPSLNAFAAPGAQKQSTIGAKKSQERGESQTFTGLVEWEYKTLYWDCDVPNCDHFALYDDATKMNYEIDDARAALPFEGKRAKITGILNPKTDTIHLLSIEPLK